MQSLFSVLFFIGTFAMSQLNQVDNQTETKSVQGVSTSSLPTLSPSPALSPTSTPKPVVKNVFMQLSPTPEKREIGAWYWRKELGRAQRWLGLDKDGNDIWTDSGDPTPTPTLKPQAQQQQQSSVGASTIQTSQESYGTPSMSTANSVRVQLVNINRKVN